MPSASDGGVRARLFTRADCSLCDRAALILQRLADEKLLTWETVDISADPMLLQAYGSRIPVVELSTDEIFEGRISEFRLRHHLARQTTSD